jgi:hypothetical protein
LFVQFQLQYKCTSLLLFCGIYFEGLLNKFIPKKTPFPDESLFEAENEEYMNKDIDWENIDLSTTTPWDPDHKSEEPKETQPITAPIYKTPLVKDTSIGYESGQEKINDILYDPALEKQQKMIQTPHGEFPDYDLGQKFGMVIKLSPKYKAFDDGPVVKSEGPVPDYAQLKLNSTLMFGPTRFVMDYVITEEECKTLAGLRKGYHLKMIF